MSDNRLMEAGQAAQLMRWDISGFVQATIDGRLPRPVEGWGYQGRWRRCDLEEWLERNNPQAIHARHVLGQMIQR